MAASFSDSNSDTSSDEVILASDDETEVQDGEFPDYLSYLSKSTDKYSRTLRHIIEKYSDPNYESDIIDLDNMRYLTEGGKEASGILKPYGKSELLQAAPLANESEFWAADKEREDTARHRENAILRDQNFNKTFVINGTSYPESYVKSCYKIFKKAAENHDECVPEGEVISLHSESESTDSLEGEDCSSYTEDDIDDETESSVHSSYHPDSPHVSTGASDVCHGSASNENFGASHKGSGCESGEVYPQRKRNSELHRYKAPRSPSSNATNESSEKRRDENNWSRNYILSSSRRKAKSHKNVPKDIHPKIRRIQPTLVPDADVSVDEKFQVLDIDIQRRKDTHSHTSSNTVHRQLPENNQTALPRNRDNDYSSESDYSASNFSDEDEVESLESGVYEIVNSPKCIDCGTGRLQENTFVIEPKKVYSQPSKPRHRPLKTIDHHSPAGKKKRFNEAEIPTYRQLKGIRSSEEIVETYRPHSLKPEPRSPPSIEYSSNLPDSLETVQPPSMKLESRTPKSINSSLKHAHADVVESHYHRSLKQEARPPLSTQTSSKQHISSLRSSPLSNPSKSSPSHKLKVLTPKKRTLAPDDNNYMKARAPNYSSPQNITNQKDIKARAPYYPSPQSTTNQKNIKARAPYYPSPQNTPNKKDIKARAPNFHSPHNTPNQKDQQARALNFHSPHNTPNQKDQQQSCANSSRLSSNDLNKTPIQNEILSPLACLIRKRIREADQESSKEQNSQEPEPNRFRVNLNRKTPERNPDADVQEYRQHREIRIPSVIPTQPRRLDVCPLKSQQGHKSPKSRKHSEVQADTIAKFVKSDYSNKNSNIKPLTKYSRSHEQESRGHRKDLLSSSTPTKQGKHMKMNLDISCIPKPTKGIEITGRSDKPDYGLNLKPNQLSKVLSEQMKQNVDRNAHVESNLPRKRPSGDISASRDKCVSSRICTEAVRVPIRVKDVQETMISDVNLRQVPDDWHEKPKVGRTYETPKDYKKTNRRLSRSVPHKTKHKLTGRPTSLSLTPGPQLPSSKSQKESREVVPKYGKIPHSHARSPEELRYSRKPNASNNGSVARHEYSESDSCDESLESGEDAKCNEINHGRDKHSHRDMTILKTSQPSDSHKENQSPQTIQSSGRPLKYTKAKPAWTFDKRNLIDEGDDLEGVSMLSESEVSDSGTSGTSDEEVEISSSSSEDDDRDIYKPCKGYSRIEADRSTIDKGEHRNRYSQHQSRTGSSKRTHVNDDSDDTHKIKCATSSASHHKRRYNQEIEIISDKSDSIPSPKEIPYKGSVSHNRSQYSVLKEHRGDAQIHNESAKYPLIKNPLNNSRHSLLDDQDSDEWDISVAESKMKGSYSTSYQRREGSSFLVIGTPKAKLLSGKNNPISLGSPCNGTSKRSKAI